MAGISAGLGGQINNNIQTDGLIVYLDAAYKKSYPKTGTTWTDLSSGGNDGTLTNGPTFNSDNGGSITFDGSNDYADISSGIGMASDSSHTGCAWIRMPNVSDTDRRFFFESADDSNNFVLSLAWRNNTSQNIFQAWTTDGGGSNYTSADSTTNPVDDTWYYVCQRTDSTANTLDIFVNGIKEGTSTSATFTIDSFDSMAIGTYRSKNDRYMKGNISNVTIYNRALLDGEITQNYNAQKGRFGY